MVGVVEEVCVEFIGIGVFEWYVVFDDVVFGFVVVFDGGEVFV